VYGKIVGYVVVHEFVFWVRELLGKVVINGYVLICKIGVLEVDVAGRVSERCCLALRVRYEGRISLVSVK
jgi:hypothetical protein